MPRGRKVSPEQIVVMLRQIEVQVAQGMSLALACKEAGISEQSYYRWRREYGGRSASRAPVASMRARTATLLPCATWTSIWRSITTICSGLTVRPLGILDSSGSS